MPGNFFGIPYRERTAIPITVFHARTVVRTSVQAFDTGVMLLPGCAVPLTLVTLVAVMVRRPKGEQQGAPPPG